MKADDMPTSTGCNDNFARPDVAVIGSGIAGSSCAWALRDDANVTLFEQDELPGGHTATRDIVFDDRTIAVDTGFIVFNTLNYPLLTALFDHLDVATEESDMSFSLSFGKGRMEWAGSDDWRQAVAQKRNILRPRFWSMLRGMKRFNELSAAQTGSPELRAMTLGDWLDRHRFSRAFREDYLIPMSASIWSSPEHAILDFPADAFLHFFDNHRLNSLKRPKWRTVSGGSRNYLRLLLAELQERDRLKLNAKVREIRPSAAGPVVITDTGEHRFDQVVLACHSDQSRALLAANGEHLRNDLLAAIPYRPNRVVLHSDASFMPVRKRAWAAWNYNRAVADGASPDVTVTYWMNRLQNIDPACPVFVTLNPDREPNPALVYGEWSYDHPQFDRAGLRAQERLDEVQGQDGIWLAGAWTGYGFHEDGLRSGLRVAKALGATLPFASDLAPAGGHALADGMDPGAAPLEAAE